MLFIPCISIHDIFYENTIIIEFDLIMLYKIYYESNIEQSYLFVTNKMSYFLQVDIFNKKNTYLVFMLILCDNKVPAAPAPAMLEISTPNVSLYNFANFCIPPSKIVLISSVAPF